MLRFFPLTPNINTKRQVLRYPRCARFPIKTGDNGNAMFQSYLSKLFQKETG